MYKHEKKILKNKLWSDQYNQDVVTCALKILGRVFQQTKLMVQYWRNWLTLTMKFYCSLENVNFSKEFSAKNFFQKGEILLFRR